MVAVYVRTELIKLTAAGRRLLARATHLNLTAIATFDSPGQPSVSVSKNFVLRQG
jgi:hypothetical protein